MHEHADFIGLMASVVRVAIFDARTNNNKSAARWLFTAGLAERAGIALPPMLLDEQEPLERELSPLLSDRLPPGKRTTVWELGDVRVVSVIGKRCCYGVLKGEEVKHIVPASKAWRVEKAHAIELAKALL